MKKLIILLLANAFALLLHAQSITYQYDYEGRVTLVIYPNGQTINYTYDAAGNRINKLNNVPCGLIPKPIITASRDTVFCPGDSAVLNAPELSNNVYQWKRNGSIISGAINSTFAAKLSGAYTVVITYINGCKDSSNTINILQNPAPKTGFTINDSVQCINNNSFVFTDTSSISAGVLSRFWKSDDGDTSTNLNFTKGYASIGTKSIKLIETSLLGCKDSISKTIRIKAAPLANITALNSLSFCAGGNATLKADTASGYSYQWLKNNAIIVGANSYLYTTGSNGIYSVKVSISNGCSDTSNEIIIGTNPIPKVGFTINANPQCLSHNQFIFTDTSSVSSGTLTRLWKFGNGDTSSFINPTETYVSSGSFQVKLIVSSSFGCVDSTTKSVSIINSITSHITSADTLTICANTTTLLSADTASGNLYQWMKNGSIISGANQSKYNASLGVYRVIVSNLSGCSDTSNTIWVLQKANPLLGFTINNSSQCITGNSFRFTDTTSQELSRKWYFSNGDSSAVKNLLKSFSNTGSIAAKLIATGTNGCKDSITKVISVNPMPTASFNINNIAQCLNGNNFIFTDNSTISTGTLNRRWDFGNGDTSSLNPKSITYTNATAYTIKLMSISDFGCKDSISKSVTVYPSPNAGFTVNNSIQCLTGNNFIFTDTSSIPSGTIIRTWNFGDTSNAVNNPTSKSYNYAALFNVTLSAISNNGCQAFAQKTVTVNPIPIPDFSINNNTQCLNGNNFIFNDNSVVSGGSTSKWNFGNGDQSTISNPSETYSTSGNYTVKLVSTSLNGCSDSISKSINVSNGPLATISNSKGVSGFCTNDSILLNAGVGAPYYQWLLFGAPISGANLNKLYVNTGGDYQVIISNSIGCTDTSAIFTVNQVALPIVGAIVGPPIVKSLLNPVTYSVSPQANHLYYWTLVGGNILSGQGTNSVNIQWVLTGNNRIRIEMVNSNFCADTTLLNVSVSAGMHELIGNNSIVVFPNPASDKFMVSSSQTEIKEINLYDASGRLVINSKLNNSEVQINISDISAGIYQLEVKTENGFSYFKIMKN